MAVVDHSRAPLTHAGTGRRAAAAAGACARYRWPWPTGCSRCCSRPVFFLLWRVRVEGRENVPSTGRRCWPPTTSPSATPSSCRWWCGARSPSWPRPSTSTRWRTAWFFRAAGQIPIRRGGGPVSERALATAREVLGRGRLLGLYPEGTRSVDAYVHKGRTGVARLSRECGVPVVPVGIVGTVGGAAGERPADAALQDGDASASGPPCAWQPAADPAQPLADHDHRVCREFTDDLMKEIARLSERDYVDEYVPEAGGWVVGRYVVRIALLPDRPGALGQVASRIGAVGGDIVAIDILDRSRGRAVDEFVLELSGDHLVELLRTRDPRGGRGPGGGHPQGRGGPHRRVSGPRLSRQAPSPVERPTARSHAAWARSADRPLGRAGRRRHRAATGRPARRASPTRLRPGRPGWPPRGRWTRPSGAGPPARDWSAWSWRRRSIADAPPSARSSASGSPVAAVMASTMSRTWKAMASTTARASWARPVPRVRPVIVPRARGSHHGLPRPVKAGTTVTPAAVGDRAGQRADVLGPVDDPEPVAQPLDGRPGDEGGALERVGDRLPAAPPWLAEVPGDRGDQAVGRRPGRSSPTLASTKLPVP